jgi:hypothetical protein
LSLLLYVDGKVDKHGSLFDEAAHQKRPLKHKGGYEKIKADAAVAVSLEKGHQEAEADEHHAVHVHEHFYSLLE